MTDIEKIEKVSEMLAVLDAVNQGYTVGNEEDLMDASIYIARRYSDILNELKSTNISEQIRDIEF